MEPESGLCFKLVYSDWYIKSSEKRPFGNMMPSKIREFIQESIRRDLNIDCENELQKGQEEKPIKFDHSELLNYFNRNFPKNIVSCNQIMDDDFIYIYPIEIKTNLSALNDINKFNLNGEKYEWYFKNHIPEIILNNLKTGKVKILINCIHDPLYDEAQIRAFEVQLNKLGVDGGNIIFLGGSKFSEYFIKHPTSRVKLYSGHLFIRGYLDQIKEFPCVGNLGYICELADESDLNENIKRDYKFLCANRTMEKPQRAAMGYFFIKYNLKNEGLFSFIQSDSPNKIQNSLSKVFKNYNEEYLDELIKLLPYELDTNDLELEKKAHFGSKNNKKEWYNNSYFHIVTETYFGPNVFLSEKIFKPIANLQPFLVLGDYLTLFELKKLGFKTFEPFIDESYDTERDSYKRMELLEKEIIKLKNMSIDEIHNWYYSIVDILIFNKKHLYSFENYECFESIFEQIKIDYTTQKHTQWNLQEKRLL